jgi:hypothetical protein
MAAAASAAAATAAAAQPPQDATAVAQQLLGLLREAATTPGAPAKEASPEEDDELPYGLALSPDSEWAPWLTGGLWSGDQLFRQLDYHGQPFHTNLLKQRAGKAHPGITETSFARSLAFYGQPIRDTIAEVNRHLSQEDVDMDQVKEQLKRVNYSMSALYEGITARAAYLTVKHESDGSVEAELEVQLLAGAADEATRATRSTGNALLDSRRAALRDDVLLALAREQARSIARDRVGSASSVGRAGRDRGGRGGAEPFNGGPSRRDAGRGGRGAGRGRGQSGGGLPPSSTGSAGAGRARDE